MASQNVRVEAVRVMQHLHTRGGSLTRLLPDAQQRVAGADRALLQASCYGLARWSWRLAGLVDQLLQKPLKQKDLDVHLLMQLGVFQLEFTRMAAHAAVDTTVTAAAKLGKPWARGLVNGVLRNYQRQSTKLEAGLSESARLAHPPWLLTQLRKDWPDDYAAIVAANNAQGPMTLRVNGKQNSCEDYRQVLAATGHQAQVVAIAPDALVLDAPLPVNELPGFAAGQVSVQDAAAQLAATILAQHCPAGGRLLDACSAPGGKTTHALESGHWQSVLALDHDAQRLQRVGESVLRLQLTEQVSMRCADAAQTDDWWDGQAFDAVLLDAPCTGTGVIRRHPDIKLLRRPDDVQSLAERQLSLLHALWPTVAANGYLLYATCSVLKAENDQVITQFLADTPDARALDPLPDWPDGVCQAGSAGRQILPGENGMDGFFYALLVKAS